jgi:hypothetical protein
MASNYKMINEQLIGKAVDGSGHVISLKGLRKATKGLSQNSQYLDQDLNLGPPKYKAGMLTTWP